MRAREAMRSRLTPFFLLASALVLVVGVFFGALVRSELRVERTVAAEVAGRVAERPTSIVPAPPITTTTTTTTTEPPPPPLRDGTLVFTGDTLAHRGLVQQARRYAADLEGDAPPLEYDFAPMFRLVEPHLAGADLAICHLETPLSPDNRSLSGYPTFNVPGDLAAGLAAVGYDGCSTASNHSLDKRSDGVTDTLDVLDDAELAHSGTARTEREARTTTMYDVAGIAVANLSYTYGFNGFSLPDDEPWRANVIDIERIAADIVRARLEGAEYVVVSAHWGTEYRHDPNDDQLRWATELAAIEGIDLVIGHHAHVLQPIERIGDTFVVYGLGNFLSNQSSGCCVDAAQDGLLLRVTLQEVRHADDTTSFETTLSYVPTRVDRTDFTIVPVVDALELDGLSALSERELERTRTRTADVLGRLADDSWVLVEQEAVLEADSDS